MEEVAPFKGVQSLVLISKRRCQVIWTNPISTKGAATTAYVPLNPPKSAWAEFLIFYVPQRDSEEAKYYVIPRSELPRHTSYSPNSKRLAQYEGAGAYLKETNEVDSRNTEASHRYKG